MAQASAEQRDRNADGEPATAFFSLTALNFFVRCLRLNRQSESRSYASLCVGLSPVSVCDCERQSSDRGSRAAFPETPVRSVHTTLVPKGRRVDHFRDERCMP